MTKHSPFGDGFVADAQRLGKPALGELFFLPQLPDGSPGYIVIHKLLSSLPSDLPVYAEYALPDKMATYAPQSFEKGAAPGRNARRSESVLKLYLEYKRFF